MQLGQINQCLLAVAIKKVASDGLQWSHRDLLAALVLIPWAERKH